MLRSTHLRQVLFLPENGKTVSSGVPPAELEDLVVPLSGPGGATSPNFGNKLSRNPDGECSGKISCCTTRALGRARNWKKLGTGLGLILWEKGTLFGGFSV